MIRIISFIRTISILTIMLAASLAYAGSKSEAQGLFAAGDAMAAYEMYMELLRAEPEDEAVILGTARTAAASGKLNQAVMAYELLIERRPKEPVLYGELAQVYMQLGERESAEHNFEIMRSLDGSTTKEDIDKMLDSMNRRYSLFQLSGKLKAGMIYDTNANSGPDSDDLLLGNWRVNIDNAKAIETYGAYFGANIDTAYRFSRVSSWWLVGGIELNLRGNFAEEMEAVNNTHSEWGRVSLGGRYLGSTVLTELRLKGELFDYEFEQRVFSYGIEATLLWAIKSNIHLILKGDSAYRSYSEASDREGLSSWVGIFGRYIFGSDELLLGSRYMETDTEEKDYSYNGFDVMASATFKLPFSFDITPSVGYSMELYEGAATVLETEKREDKKLRAGASIVYHITKAWSGEFQYQYSTADSTSALYTHNQHMLQLGVAWKF